MKKPFGYVGKNEIIYADEWNKPKDSIEIHSVKPGDNYVLDRTGNWEINTNVKSANEQASKARAEAILKEWPIDKQLEAITESLMGKPEKMKELEYFLKSIKMQYPKYSE